MLNVPGLETALRYKFVNPEWARQALTHSSAAPAMAPEATNARLAHVGDAVVGLAVREHLFRHHRDWDKGKLPVETARRVRNSKLASISRDLHLPDFMDIQNSPMNERLRAEVLEAAIGAVHFDSNYATAAKVVEQVVLGAG